MHYYIEYNQGFIITRERLEVVVKQRNLLIISDKYLLVYRILQ